MQWMALSDKHLSFDWGSALAMIMSLSSSQMPHSVDPHIVVIALLSAIALHQPLIFFLSFFDFPPPSLVPDASPPCISAIMSLKRLSLTPPPLTADE